MTIRRGEPWGTQVARPPDLLVAGGNAELADLAARRPHDDVSVCAGDVHRSLGAPGLRSEAQRLPMDLLVVSIDGRTTTAAAHVVARRSWWRGTIVAVMNVDHCGAWIVAPRAHPNDGRFDIVEVTAAMSIRDRVMARRRMPSGSHVPHPAISVTTSTSQRWRFHHPTRISIDGSDAGRCRELEITIRPDAYHLVV
jgi:hypothetical protein